MQKINLRDLYPDVYKTDVFVDVAEEVLAAIRGKWPGKRIVFNAVLLFQRVMGFVPEFPALIGCIGLLLALDYCQHFFSHIHKGIGFIYIRIQVPKIDLLHYVPPFRFTG